jgi:hypothetical protein
MDEPVHHDLRPARGSGLTRQEPVTAPAQPQRPADPAPTRTKDKPQKSKRQQRHALAARNYARTASATARPIGRWIEA